LPAMGNVRARAQGAACQNNLKQIGIAMNSYYVEYESYMPSYTAYSMSTGCTWLGSRDSQGRINVKSSIFFPYLGKSWKVVVCPAVLETWGTGDPETFWGGGGYGYNYTGIGTQFYFGATVSGMNDRMIPGMREVARPSETVAFADTINANDLMGAASENPKASFLLYGPAQVTNRTPSRGTGHYKNMHFRHAGMANFLWADGHTTLQRMDFSKGESESALPEKWKKEVGSIGDPNSDKFFTPLNYDQEF